MKAPCQNYTEIKNSPSHCLPLRGRWRCNRRKESAAAPSRREPYTKQAEGVNDAMKPVISGIQQIGVGIPDVNNAFKWYRENLGFDVPIFDDPGVADRMLPYTGGIPQSRHAVLAINMQGGGGLEIWQYTSRQPQPPSFEPELGDLGINAVKIKTQDIKKAYGLMTTSNVGIQGGIEKTPDGIGSFFIKDPYGNVFQIEENRNAFMKTDFANGGVAGAIIGVSRMEAAVGFYKEILGYDDLIYDTEGIFPDLEPLAGGCCAMRRVLLGHKEPRKGAFSRMFGKTRIELVQALDRKPRKIFEGRFWGDLGFIHLCFDIRGMADMRELCRSKGCPFTVDSNPETDDGKTGTFDMGDAAGCFAYAEDPDGTLIEFVEAHKIPIMKKLGLFLNMRKRNPEKPLPDWMLKTLKFSRKH